MGKFFPVENTQLHSITIEARSRNGALSQGIETIKKLHGSLKIIYLSVRVRKVVGFE